MTSVYQLKASYPYYLANTAVFANTDLEVVDKYTGVVATRVARAHGITVEALARANNLTPHQRLRPGLRLAIPAPTA